MSHDQIAGLRRAVLAVVVVASLGAATDLVLLAHYEDPWQVVPLVAIGLAACAVTWHLLCPGTASLRALQATMVAFILAGFLGVLLHFQGAAEFQLEIDPTQTWWTIAAKAIRAKAPPVMAPALMAQLGALGLIYTLWEPQRPAGAPRPTHTKEIS